MTDTAGNIKIDILISSNWVAERMLKEFASAFNIKWASYKIVRAKLQQEYEKRVFPPLNNRIKGEVRARLKAKWEREGKNTSGGPFEAQVIIEFDEWTKLGKDKTYRRRSQERQRINVCYDILENGHKPESELPSGLNMDDDGNSEKPNETPPRENKTPNDKNAPCHACKTTLATNWKKRTNGRYYCQTCYDRVPNCYHCGKKKGWYQSSQKGSERFCSQECLNEWARKPKDNPGGPPKPRNRQSYLQELTGLTGWELLTEDEKDRFKEMIRNSLSETDWKNAIEKAKILIKEKGGDEENPDEEDDENDNENLSAEIQKAIQEIEAELNKEPKITTQDENWRTYIESSSTLVILNSRKQKILDDIQAIREQQGGDKKNLTELRLRAIQLIKQALEDNSISDSELTNPNWENDINQAQSESAIKEIQNWVLADIKNKKAAKEERNLLNQLLTQAKEEKNWNNYQILANILQQIKELRSSNAYKEKEQQIQEVESRLKQLNPDKFKETKVNLLDQQVKNNGLTDSNMDDETKQALAEAKQDPTPEKVAKAEEKIAQNGANNNLNNLITQIESKLKKSNLTEKEKAKLITDLLQFISKNNYQVTAYQKQKYRVDKLLSELRGEKSKDNTQNPPFWKKVLVPLLIISLLGIMITGILIWRRKRLKAKGKWK